MAISLFGTDLHRSSDGAIRSRRGSNNEKKKWESPIATTFSAFRTSSILTKADSQRRARVRVFAEFSLATRPGRCVLSLHSGFQRLPIRSSNHIGADSKGAGTATWRLDLG